ncbi:MAG: nucleotidyl transferase AbiEii/AbiGii toxin family protein [Candidatus Peribacteria bacterium]|nr:nucleotidyl transferase AbiEii/AbiGii toxin family protein [Candidatus Peribacteria bacterium]
MKVQDKATIFTNKLFALSERQANRDIYDVYFFFKNLFPINEEAIKEKTGKNLKEFLILIKEKLEKIPVHHKILDGL